MCDKCVNFNLAKLTFKNTLTPLNKEKMRGKGVTTLLYHHFYETFRQKVKVFFNLYVDGIQTCF